MQTTETMTVTEKRFYARYLRHSWAIGITWAILTCCFAVINVIVFVQPQWIGDTMDTPGTGWVGLYQVCELIESSTVEVCQGSIQEFSTILSDAFRAATVLIGISCLIIFLCILLFLLFLFCPARIVFVLLGVLQVLSAICMLIGCVVYPRGWDSRVVRRICGLGANRYDIGKCEMRWAYILAIIGFFDILILACLAFVLAARQARDLKKTKEPIKTVTHMEMIGTMESKHGTMSMMDHPDNYSSRQILYNGDSYDRRTDHRSRHSEPLKHSQPMRSAEYYSANMTSLQHLWLVKVTTAATSCRSSSVKSGESFNRTGRYTEVSLRTCITCNKYQVDSNNSLSCQSSTNINVIH